MNAGKIRGYLLRNPKPNAVRISGDFETQTLKVGRSFTKLSDTIAALGPELIECLDSKGEIIRATRTDEPETQRSDAAPIPAALAADPQALQLTHFADLLHRAYMFSTEIAFNKLTECLERVNDRSDGIEARLERMEAHNRRLLQEQVDNALDRADEIVERATEEAGGGDFLQNMASSFLSGQMQAPKPKPAASQTNGKGHA